MNADDIYTKKYSATSFARKDDKRISIRRKDQKFMTKKDIDQLTKMKHVVSVDQYDIVNDVNYYFEEGKDYRQEYGYNRMSTSNEGGLYDSQNVEYVKKDQYMRSSSCLKKSDLVKGSRQRRSMKLYCTIGENIRLVIRLHFSIQAMCFGHQRRIIYSGR